MTQWVLALILLALRGATLWLLVPVGTMIWIFVIPWTTTSLPQFLGWLDHNMNYVLQKHLFGLAFSTSPIQWIPRSQIATVTHRIRL
jgi:hypothetical protein